MPPEFRFDLRWIDGVAPVVARTILDKRDQASVRFSVRSKRIEGIADTFDDGDVLGRRSAADVIGFPDPSALQNRRQRLDVILDVKPIPHVAAIAVNRQWLFFEGVEKHERYEFFRKMVGAVVVRAVRYERRQPIGFTPSADEMIGGSFAGRVGRSRVVGGAFREKAVVGEATVNFVGRNV